MSELAASSSSGPERIGLFGSAFDPPHNAHLALARAFIQAWQLTVLHVLPTGQSWHKKPTLSSATDRLAMTALAFEGISRIVIDDQELLRSGPTYTIDTLSALTNQYPKAMFVLQIGSDEAAFFHRWHQARDIASKCSISIAPRLDREHNLLPLDPNNLLPGLEYDRDKVQILDLPTMNHSATQIRCRVRKGLPINHLVAPKVATYIAAHHLYESNP